MDRAKDGRRVQQHERHLMSRKTQFWNVIRGFRRMSILQDQDKGRHRRYVVSDTFIDAPSVVDHRPSIDHQLDPARMQRRQTVRTGHQQIEPLSTVLDVCGAGHRVIICFRPEVVEALPADHLKSVLIRVEFRRIRRDVAGSNVGFETNEELAVTMFRWRTHVQESFHPDHFRQDTVAVEDDGLVNESVVDDRYLGHDRSAGDEYPRILILEHLNVRLLAVRIRLEEISAAVRHGRRISGQLHGTSRRLVSRLVSHRLQHPRLTVKEQFEVVVVQLDVCVLQRPESERFLVTGFTSAAIGAEDER